MQMYNVNNIYNLSDDASIWKVGNKIDSHTCILALPKAGNMEAISIHLKKDKTCIVSPQLR